MAATQQIDTVPELPQSIRRMTGLHAEILKMRAELASVEARAHRLQDDIRSAVIALRNGLTTVS